MYSEGSVVGKASIIGREISSTHPLIFTGNQNMRNLASFKHSLNSSRPRLNTQQDIRHVKQNTMLR